MAYNPESNGPWLAYQSTYPGLHRHFSSKELSVGTYIWRIEPHEALDQIENQSYRLDPNLTGQFMAC
jgi:hypothetical protein